MSKKPEIVNGVHGFSEEESYVPPKEKEVQEHLKWFTGQKLGFMMHWAPGSLMSTYESWPLCDSAGKWSQEDITWTDRETFKKQYEELPKVFYPVKFQPEKWARWAKACGFRYLLFTTKHHDGFCMYDTATTDYKITNPAYPFAKSPFADITGSLFDAFQREGLGVSAYFSKPDWHDDNYWHKGFDSSKGPRVNYDISEHPELWEAFVRATHAQMEEICSKYGKIDVLWLDGGWVRPDNFGQDIRLNEVIGRIRSTTQPHLIVADRTVGGEFENIVTPEQEIPEHPIRVPWETCMTVGGYFSFHYDDRAKPGIQLVHTLLDVVSKGGNLALNLTPRPDGLFPADQVKSVNELGTWMAVHGDGIYDTVICAPYQQENVCFTQKDGKVFAFYKYNEIPALPEEFTVTVDREINRVSLMRTGQSLRLRQRGDKLTIYTESISTAGAMFADGFVLEE